MQEEENRSSRRKLTLDGIVADFFSLESVAASSRTADAYKAIDLSKRSSIGIWVSRYPLAQNQDAIELFLRRMELIGRLGAMCDMVSYGVDAEGFGFATFPGFDGQPFLAAKHDSRESERRMLQCYKIIERMHQFGFVCGDICDSSFVLDRGGNVRFSAVIGEYAVDEEIPADSVPSETEIYLAPEQKAGGQTSPAADVYALGVLTYRVFTGRSPIPGVDASFEGIKNVPEWVDTAVKRCMTEDLNARFTNAIQLVSAVSLAKERARVQQFVPTTVAPANASAKRDPDGVRQIKFGDSVGTGMGVLDEEDDTSIWKLGLIGRISAVGLLMMTVILGYMAISKAKSKPLDPTQIDIADPLTGPRTEASEQFFSDLVTSDDPLAHDMLVRKAKDAVSPAERLRAEKSICWRANRLGLKRSSEHVRDWLKELDTGKPPPANYENILRSLDPAYPKESLTTSLKKSYEAYPLFVTQLSGLLGIELKDLDGLRNLIVPLVGDQLKLEDSSQHPTAALVLVIPGIVSKLGNETEILTKSLSPQEILWVIGHLGSKNDVGVREIINIAVEQKIATGPRAFLLDLIRRRGDLPQNVLTSLVMAASGTVNSADLGALGTWYDIDADDALLAICAEAPPEFATNAFDTLAGKSTGDGVVTALIEWVRKNYSQQRGNFAKAIGIIGLSEKEKFAEALSAFDQVVKDKDFIRIMLQSEVPELLLTAMDKFSGLFDTQTMLGLLTNPDPGVRSRAVKSLGSINDVAALKMLLDNYEKETDASVRTVYEQFVPIIRDRKR